MRSRIRRSPLIVGALVAGGLVVVPAGPTAAANPEITVTTTDDVVNGSDGVLSLREAFDQANAQAGDDIIVLGSAQTYALALCDLVPENRDLNADGDLDHTDATGALTIEGHGSTIDAVKGDACHSRAIDQRGTGLLTLNALTVTGGRPSDDFNTPDSGSGGGVSAAGDVQGTLIQLEDNATEPGGPNGPSGSFRGGGLFAAGAVVLSDANISGNRAFQGAGIFGDTVTLTSSGVSGNEATASGGGVAAAETVVLHQTIVSSNETGFYGHGGTEVQGNGGGVSAPSVDLDGSIVATNFTRGSGGGVQAETVTAVDSDIAGNRALGFGAGSSDHLPAGAGGAGIAASESVLLIDSSVRDGLLHQSLQGARTLVGHPHGAGIQSGGDVVLRRSSVYGNLSFQSSQTAGVWAAGDVTLSNSTVSHNGSQFGRGGGISAGGDVRLTHATVIRNGAPAGANVAVGERLRPNRSIIGRPRVGRNCSIDVGTASGGYNVIGAGGSCGVGHGVGDRTGVDPLNLGPIESGFVHEPTSATFSIIPPSACHALVDELGTSRPQGSRCEAGAVEVP